MFSKILQSNEQINLSMAQHLLFLLLYLTFGKKCLLKLAPDFKKSGKIGYNLYFNKQILVHYFLFNFLLEIKSFFLVKKQQIISFKRTLFLNINVPILRLTDFFYLKTKIFSFIRFNFVTINLYFHFKFIFEKTLTILRLLWFF
jgi:hypothetical protein